MLFEKNIEGAQQILIAELPFGRTAKVLVRGTGPKWMPNSQEFSFILDSRHVGVFSVPTREMTLVPDTMDAPHSVDEQVVDSTGHRLAVLYTTKSFGSLLRVYALPGLEVVGSSRVPEWARYLRFGRDGDIQFTTVGANGLREKVSADAGVTAIRKVANSPGVDIQYSVDTAATHLWVSRSQTFDLWERGSNGSLAQVTFDGQSVSGSRTAGGLLVIQRALSNAREVVVLRDRDGRETQVTDGPTDLTPSFFPDGERFLYAKVSTGELVECGVASRQCSTITSDKFVPAYPTVSPTGRQVAYLTSLNASRIKIVSVGESAMKERDLGPAQACPPVWASDKFLWVVASVSTGTKTWAEIDVSSGARTGRVRSVDVSHARESCPVPAGMIPPDGRVTQLVSLVRQKSDLAVLEPLARP